ncbi:MAG: hypothetical protein IH861_01490 [Chloroflexi bacterium]|nr:hypothetical protein [Chloroflexota bacterium]
MVTVPAFILRRLYVKQSLRNNERGFEFRLMNRLGSGYAYRLLPLTVDGLEMPAERSFFTLGESETSFADVSEENTFTLTMNKSITVRVDGTTLEPGPRKIGMGFVVPGLGTLKFDFTDVVAGE